MVFDVSAAAESALHSQRRFILPYLLCGEIPSPTGKETPLRLFPREKRGRAHQNREGILLLVLRLYRRDHQTLHDEQEANQEAHAVCRSRKDKRILPERPVVRNLFGTLLQLGMDNLLQLWVGKDIACGQIYHPLENEAFDKLFLYLRNRLGAKCIPMEESIRKIVKMRQEGKPIVIGYIADQVPHWRNIHYFTDFLHHDTPVLTGTERIVRKMNHAVYYLDVQRLKRGYYQAEFKFLTDKPNECKEFEITEMYFRALEKTIQRQPPFWLWTHNRWKRTREGWLKVLDPVTHRARA